MNGLTIEFVVYSFNCVNNVLYLILPDPLAELSQLENLFLGLLLQPTVVVTKQIPTVLFLKHSVYHVTAKQLQFYFHLQLIVLYELMSLIEGMTNHQTILFLVVLERAGRFSTIRLLQFGNAAAAYIF